MRVEVHASEKTVEIFVEADFETHAEERRRFAIMNIPRHLFSEATVRRPDAVQRKIVERCLDSGAARMTTLGDRTAWLGREDSNSNIRASAMYLRWAITRLGSANSGRQRLFAFELRGGETQLGPKTAPA